jgi:hypothetical protein
LNIAREMVVLFSRVSFTPAGPFHDLFFVIVRKTAGS